MKYLIEIAAFIILSSRCRKTKNQNTQPVTHHTDSIELNLSIISICIGELECNKIKRDSVPISITFFIDLINNTNKTVLCGRNTEYHYKEMEEFYKEKDGIIRYFYMIHQQDILLLFSRNLRINHIFPNDTSQFYAGIDEIWSSHKHPQLKNFLCKIPKEEKEYQKYLYHYLKESKFIYVPIIKDYQKVIDSQYFNKKSDFIYSIRPIKIKTDSIAFLFEES